MGIRTLKPTSPARRYMTLLTNEEITRTRPQKSLLQSEAPHERTEWRGPHHRAPPRGRAQADAARHRLPPGEVWHPGPGRLHRVRPEPLGAHRPPPLPRRREALHPGAPRPQAGRCDHVRAPGRHLAGQRPAAPQHPPGHPRPQRGAPPRQGRSAVPERGHPRPAPGQGGRPRRSQAALGRGAPGRPGRDGHRGPGGQPRPRERVGGQGGAHALARLPPDRARHRHEPGRPPDGRRRGQGQGQPPDDPVGQAHQGLQDAARSAAVRPLHRDARERRSRETGRPWDAR